MNWGRDYQENNFNDKDFKEYLKNRFRYLNSL